jgi:excisionase family DNA binding protein
MLTPSELDRLADAVAERIATKLSALTAADAMLDVYQAAELLGCSVPTVERRTREGTLPSVKVGRLRRYRRSDLLTLNEKGGRDHV